MFDYKFDNLGVEELLGVINNYCFDGWNPINITLNCETVTGGVDVPSATSKILFAGISVASHLTIFDEAMIHVNYGSILSYTSFFTTWLDARSGYRRYPFLLNAGENLIISAGSANITADIDVFAGIVE